MAEAQNNKVDRTKLILNTIKTYVIVVIGFGITGVAVVAVIVPLFGAISSVSNKIVAEETEVEKVRARAEYLQTLSGLKDQLETNIQTAQEAVPMGEDSVPYALDQIVFMAKQSNLEVESLALGQIVNSSEANKPNVVRMQLNVSGAYVNMIDLLDKIENSRRILDVSSISMNSDQAAEGSAESSKQGVTLTLITYFMPDVDTSQLTPDLLGPVANTDKVLEALGGLTYYSPDQLLTVPQIEILPLEEVSEPTPVDNGGEDTGIIPIPSPTPETSP